MPTSPSTHEDQGPQHLPQARCVSPGPATLKGVVPAPLQPPSSHAPSLPHFAFSVHVTRSRLSRPETQGPHTCDSAQLTYAEHLLCTRLYGYGGEQGRQGPHIGAANAVDRCIQKPSEGRRPRVPGSPKRECSELFISGSPAPPQRGHRGSTWQETGQWFPLLGSPEEL